jgi:hypothetical protein
MSLLYILDEPGSNIVCRASVLIEDFLSLLRLCWDRADEHVARVPKLARSIHCCPNFSPDQPSFFEECIYFYEGLEIVHQHHHHHYEMMLRVNNCFIQSGSS